MAGGRISGRYHYFAIYPHAVSRIAFAVRHLNLSKAAECGIRAQLVRIRYLHFGPEWDSINQECGPLNPLESLDIEGGLGFLGAYRTDSYTYEINTE